MEKIAAAIIGSGNIGTDLMKKILKKNDSLLRMGAMVGIDAKSDGLKRANDLGVATTHEGIDGLLALPNFNEIKIVFDATSAGAHIKHNELLQKHGIRVIDLTPAAIGPYVVPVVNLTPAVNSVQLNLGDFSYAA